MRFVYVQKQYTRSKKHRAFVDCFLQKETTYTVEIKVVLHKQKKVGRVYSKYHRGTVIWICILSKNIWIPRSYVYDTLKLTLPESIWLFKQLTKKTCKFRAATSEAFVQQLNSRSSKTSDSDA